MSRHELVPLDRAHQVVVGWDRPLHTFFAQVLDVAADEDGDTRTVLWIGGEFDAVPDPATVVEAVRPFATTPADLAQALRDDRAASIQSMDGGAGHRATLPASPSRPEVQHLFKPAILAFIATLGLDLPAAAQGGVSPAGPQTTTWQQDSRPLDAMHLDECIYRALPGRERLTGFP